MTGGADAALDLIEQLIRQRMAVLHKQGRDATEMRIKRASHLRADELGLLVAEIKKAREAMNAQ